MFTLRVDFLTASLPRIPSLVVLSLYLCLAMSNNMSRPFLYHVVRERECTQSKFVKHSSGFAVNQAIVRKCSTQFLDSNQEDSENVVLLV